MTQSFLLMSRCVYVCKSSHGKPGWGTALRAHSLGKADVICKLLDGLLCLFQKALCPLLGTSAFAQRESLISPITLIKALQYFIGD